MNKKVDALKTIGEVSKELKIHTHIIRFWETKFDKLKSVKRKNNHRYYSKDDIFFIKYVNKDKNIKLVNNEEVYLKLLNEIKTDICNIINEK